MSRDRKRKGGWVRPAELAKGSGGRVLCRFCGLETRPPRRTFCSDLCVHEWRLRTDPGYLREQIFKRDRGKCSLCGLDTEGLRRKLLILRKRNRTAWLKQVGELRIPRGRTTLWDADHIVAVTEGGGECGLDNLRTLCLVDDAISSMKIYLGARHLKCKT